MRIERIKLEDAWLMIEFDDGIKGAFNVQNKADDLYKLLVGSEPIATKESEGE